MESTIDASCFMCVESVYLLFHLFAFRSTYLSFKKTMFLGGFSSEWSSHQLYYRVYLSFSDNLSSKGKIGRNSVGPDSFVSNWLAQSMH